VSFHCVVCDQRFVGAELNHCSFHPEKARFSFGSNVGEYHTFLKIKINLNIDSPVAMRGQ